MSALPSAASLKASAALPPQRGVGGKGFLFGGTGATDQQPNYTSVQVQTAVWTLPVPVVYGCIKQSPNIIDAVNFQSKDGSGGKGGGSGEASEDAPAWTTLWRAVRSALGGGKGGKSGGKDYSASVELAICEGAVDSVPLVFRNGTVLQTLSDNGMSLFTGTFPDQAPWTYLADNGFAGDAPYGYPGVAYLARANYDLGSSASVPNHEVLIVRVAGFRATWCNPSSINATAYPKLAAAFPSGIPTADLALVIQDILTNTQYGILNFPSSAINATTLLSGSNATTTGDNAAQTYWRALGLGFTINLNSSETFQSTLGRWLKIGNCAAVWSGTALKFIPYGDATVTANGVTYLPNLTPVYALDDDAYVGDASADPVLVDRTDPAEAYNVARVEVTVDDGWFSYVPVEARSQNDAEMSGAPRIMSSVQAHEILGQTNGLIVAQLLLKQQLLWRNTVTLKLSWEFSLLECMDFVTVTDYDLGYINQLCRVLSVEEDENLELTVTLQKYTPGSSTHSNNHAGQVTGHGIPDQGQTASNVSPPVIFEPSSLLSGVPQYWIAACGGNGSFDPFWGGAQVWISSDNANYKHVGDITGPARTGALTTTLAAYGGSNPDTINTLSVDLSESGGTLETVSAGDAANAATLCYVDGELLSFETATLVSQNATEIHNVPSIAGYSIAVNHSPTYVSDGGVAYVLGGAPLTYTAGIPGPGQYTVVAGYYGFNAADAGVAVSITYTWNNPNHYALTTLYRGLYGTTPGSHSSTTKFARLDGAVFQSDLPLWAIGHTMYVKLVSFTSFPGTYPGLQDISTITPVTLAPQGIGYGTGLAGVPAQPTGVAGGTTLTAFSLIWNANPKADNVVSYIVQRSPHGAGIWTTVGNPTGPCFTESIAAPTATPGSSFDYRVIAVNAAGQSIASAIVTLGTGSSIVVASLSFSTTTTPSAPSSGWTMYADTADGWLKGIPSTGSGHIDEIANPAA